MALLHYVADPMLISFVPYFLPSFGPQLRGCLSGGGVASQSTIAGPGIT